MKYRFIHSAAVCLTKACLLRLIPKGSTEVWAALNPHHEWVLNPHVQEIEKRNLASFGAGGLEQEMR